MKGEIELYNISFLILKVELHFNLLYVHQFTLFLIYSYIPIFNSFYRKFSQISDTFY